MRDGRRRGLQDGRAALRRATYRELKLATSVTVQTAVIDRLLDRRLILMGVTR